MATINKIPKCPPLRFPDFNDDWTQTTLGEIAEILSSQRVFASEYKDHGIPFYRGKEISELRRGHTPSDLLYISKDLYNEYQFNYGVPQLGDILITAVGTLGNLWIVDDSLFYFKDGNIIWLKSPQLYPYFLYSSLEYHKKNLLALAIGSSQKALTIEGVRKLNIAYPTSSEQKKIADFLSLIDERITNLSETIKELKTQKAGLLNLLFSQKLRFPDFNDEWTQTTLGEATIIIMGQSPSSVNYNEEGIGLPLIQGNADMCSGTTIVRLYTSEITKEALKNDIIMSVRAPVGALAITPFRCCIGRGVCAIRADKYIYYYLQLCSKIWSKYSAGSTFDSITGENIRHLPLSLPSLAEQKKIADFLSLIDDRIEVEEQLLKKYEEQKKYLLRHMFV